MTANPVTILGTEVHSIQSQHVGRELRVWVARPLPPFMPRSPEPAFLVCVLDADLFFGTVVETTRLMYQLFGELPPTLVVGVAYPTEDRRVQGELRARDFTPSKDPALSFPGGAPPPASEPTLPEGERTGGAEAFARFLREELLPFVRSHYEVQSEGSTLLGSSMGGLFASWMLLSEPSAFDGYVIASPALWWEGPRILEREAEFARSRKDLAARVFFAAGASEETPGNAMLAPFRMISNARELATRLQSHQYPTLAVECRVFEGETHTSVVPVAITHGLRFAYRKR
jgi:predicted alpha/beta superfamily hydrolase